MRHDDLKVAPCLNDGLRRKDSASEFGDVHYKGNSGLPCEGKGYLHSVYIEQTPFKDYGHAS